MRFSWIMLGREPRSSSGLLMVYAGVLAHGTALSGCRRPRNELVMRLGRDSEADYFADFDEEGGELSAGRGGTLEPEIERACQRGLDLDF